MSHSMMTAQWNVDVHFEEDPEHTIATATLHTPDGRRLRGTGRARRNPSDRPMARIGEEIACARALSHLTHELLDYSSEEIEANVHRGAPVA